MPNNMYQKWESRELIPFLQRDFAYSVVIGNVESRDWDRAWYRIVQSARYHVRGADVQSYSSTPYSAVNRLYLALVHPSANPPSDMALASMSVESCAIVFVQHAKTYGPYPLRSRLGAWLPLDWAFMIECEEAIERRSKQQRQYVDPDESSRRDREKETFNRLFHEGRWSELVDYNLNQIHADELGFQTAERPSDE